MSENLFAHSVIRASAGSGKTYKLSERFIKLLLAGAPVDSILATTFTRKAAGEILNRILERLAKGALSQENANQLSSELFEQDATRLSREKLRDLTVSITRSLDKLRVCTLDAFFIRIAKGFQFEIGLPPNWQVVEEIDNDALLQRALQATFARTSPRNAHELTKLLFKGEAERNVESQLIEMVASALDIFRNSSEEAWTALERALPETKSLDECIDALNAAELPKKKKNNKSAKPDDPLSQYDGHFVKARNTLLENLSNKNWENICASGLCKPVLNGSLSYQATPIEGDLLEALQNIVAYVKVKQLSVHTRYLRTLRFLLEYVDHFYRQFKREDGAYRFEDLSFTLAQLQMRDQLRRVVYRLDSKTSHLLLDEFQDSSLEQWSIIKPFAESITQRRSDSLNLDNPNDVAQLTSFFCVGDVKQAIYGWRGGVAEIFQEVEETLPNLEIIGMEVNWRSCPTIIDLVNKIFGELSQNSLWLTEEKKDNLGEVSAIAVNNAVKKWENYFQTHQVAETNKDKPGYWTLEVAPRCDEEDDPPELARNKFTPIYRSRGENAPTTNLFESDAPLQFDLYEPDEENEDDQEDLVAKRQPETTVDYAVRRIAQLARQYPEYSIGVLTRTNKLLAAIMRGLKAAGIEASSEGGVPIVDAPATLAMLSLFKLAAHPGDLVAAFHIANVAPLAGKYRISTRNYNEEAQRVSARLRQRIETIGVGRFAAEIRELLIPICREPNNLERLDKFVEFAFSYQENQRQVILDRFINAVQKAKRESPSTSKVRVMTIHKSKGLEFDIVVLPELDCYNNSDLISLKSNQLFAGHDCKRNPADGKLEDSSLTPIRRVINYANKKELLLLPDEYRRIFAHEQQKLLEEALCLLYVAITRPVRMLVAIIDPIKLKESDESKNAKTSPKKKNATDADEAGAQTIDPLAENGSKKLSFANILRRALAEDKEKIEPASPYFKHAQVVFEEGNANWADKDRLQKRSVKQAEETGDSALGAPTFQRVSQKRLLLKRDAPTGGRETVQWSPARSFTHGTAIHACFELVDWLDETGTPTDERIDRILYPILHDPGAVKRTREEFKQKCAEPYVKRLLSRATYERFVLQPGEPRPAVALDAPNLNAKWRVFRERPFTQRVNGTLFHGIIDRLVLLYDGDRVVAADVVDYKSDQIKDETGQLVNEPEQIPQKTLEEYRKQLAIYGDVVQSQYDLPKERVSLRLAFVAHGFTIDARS